MKTVTMDFDIYQEDIRIAIDRGTLFAGDIFRLVLKEIRAEKYDKAEFILKEHFETNAEEIFNLLMIIVGER
jgi:hypothetical protein